MPHNDLENILNFSVESQKQRNKKIEKMIALKKEANALEKRVYVKNIKDVPKELIFSDKTFWCATNLETLDSFEFTGTIVGFHALRQKKLREMLINGEIDAFDSGKFYMKFLYMKP